MAEEKYISTHTGQQIDNALDLALNNLPVSVTSVYTATLPANGNWVSRGNNPSFIDISVPGANGSLNAGYNIIIDADQTRADGFAYLKEMLAAFSHLMSVQDLGTALRFIFDEETPNLNIYVKIMVIRK